MLNQQGKNRRERRKNTHHKLLGKSSISCHPIQGKALATLLSTQQCTRRKERGWSVWVLVLRGFFHMKYKIKTPSMVCLYDCSHCLRQVLSRPTSACPHPHTSDLPLPPRGCRAGCLIHYLFTQIANDFKHTNSNKNKTFTM